MPARGGSIGINIPVDLKLQINQMENYVKVIQDALGKIKPDTKGYDELVIKMARVSKELDAIKISSNETFRSHGQINTFSRRFEHLEAIAEDLAKSFNKIDVSSFAGIELDSNLTNSIDEAKTSLSELYRIVEKMVKEGFAKLVSSDKELQEALKGLEIDPESLIDGKGFDKITESTDALKDSIANLNKEKAKKIKTKDSSEAKYEKQKSEVEALEKNYSDLAKAAAAAEEAQKQSRYAWTKAKVNARKPLENLTNSIGKISMEKANFKGGIGLAASFIGADKKLIEQRKEQFAKDLIETFNLTAQDLQDAGFDDTATQDSVNIFYSRLLENLTKRRKDIENNLAALESNYNDKTKEANKAKTNADNVYKTYGKKVDSLDSQEKEIRELETRLESIDQEIKDAEEQISQNDKITEDSKKLIQQASDAAYGSEAGQKIKELEARVAELEAQLREATANATGAKNAFKGLGDGANSASKETQKLHQQIDNLTAQQQQLGNIQNAIKRWFGFNEVINLTKQTIRDAVDHIRELDKAMTEIAVVTDMDQDDLWGQISTYSKIAQEYGVSTVGVYEVSQLYYQQGKIWRKRWQIFYHFRENFFWKKKI